MPMIVLSFIRVLSERLEWGAWCGRMMPLAAAYVKVWCYTTKIDMLFAKNANFGKLNRRMLEKKSCHKSFIMSCSFFFNAEFMWKIWRSTVFTLTLDSLNNEYWESFVKRSVKKKILVTALLVPPTHAILVKMCLILKQRC